TVIVMRAVVPTLAEFGIPDRRPAVALNAAQLGGIWIAHVRVLPSGSLPTGVKLYAVPAVTEVDGVPVMVGARLAGAEATTCRLKGGSEVVLRMSLTEITIPVVVPTSAAVGVPERRPFEGVKVSQ